MALVGLSMCDVSRTARGVNQGTALSFVNIKEMELLKKVEDTLAESHRK